MIWAERDNAHYCGHYRIYRDTQGYTLWLYEDERNGVLQRGFKTLAAAKEYAEKHRAKQL